MRAHRGNRVVSLLGAVAVVATLSGCASSGTTEPAATDVTPCSAPDIRELSSGIVYDYEPMPSPAALAELSELVVSATIDRVQEGRVQIVPANDSVPGVPTIVLVLRDATVAQGSLAEGNDGFVYIELPGPVERDPDADAHSPLAGCQVVAYLGPSSDGAPREDIDIAIAEPLAGRPAGQALYIPSGPQSLILQYEDDRVMWPLIGETREGVLEDTLPTGNLIAP